MVCPDQSIRGPQKEKKERTENCGTLPTADIVGAVGKICAVCSGAREQFLTSTELDFELC